MADGWRVGRSLGRTLYTGGYPGRIIGMVDTPALADQIVKAVNTHDDLVAVCRTIVDRFNNWCPWCHFANGGKHAYGCPVGIAKSVIEKEGAA